MINGHLPVGRRFGRGALVNGMAQGRHPEDLGLVATNPGFSGEPWQDLWVVLSHFILFGSPSSSVVKRFSSGCVVNSRKQALQERH
ncbi:hypothetical protein [Accumulibacter sp.]|uniref:hypothetical protein n=1 Tax=Accumulibacter sp. TaxID=2053492 RepID=UPI0025F0F248|nr:hypothetical protein [Accumulibacter sp.]MCP5228539.1 hypothetical protein [Accumulibacter sp.]